MYENQPSTVPVVSGSGSNWTGTFLIFEGAMLFALRNASHTASFVDWTPIFLPIMSCGPLIGFFAIDITANGFFWYCVPTIFTFAPCLTAAAVRSGLDSATKAFLVTTSVSAAVAVGPPAMRLTF